MRGQGGGGKEEAKEERRSWGEPRTWPMAADRSARLRNVDLEHAAKELGVVHVVDAGGSVSAILILDKGKATVLLCTPRETRSVHGRAAQYQNGGRARVALSITKLTSVISPKGRKAACRVSCVTLSSSPPELGGWVRRRARGVCGARARAHQRIGFSCR